MIEFGATATVILTISHLAPKQQLYHNQPSLELAQKEEKLIEESATKQCHFDRISLKKVSAPCMLKNNIAISRLCPSSRFPIRFRMVISSTSSWVLPSTPVENQELCFCAAIFAFRLTSWAFLFSIKSSSSAAYLLWMDLNQFRLTLAKEHHISTQTCCIAILIKHTFIPFICFGLTQNRQSEG